MKKLTFVIIPDNSTSVKQFKLPQPMLKLVVGLFLIFTIAAGYILTDYFQLQALKTEYLTLVRENSGLRSEARALITSLEDVKSSLKRVKSYSHKLGEITALKVDSVTKKTGIGPLSQSEYLSAKLQDVESPSTEKAGMFPDGLNVDSLVFRPVFDRLTSIQSEADTQAFQLQKLLSSLSQQKSLINSIPSVSPVNGWIASNFGVRISPFTGDRTPHKGIDLAAATGTPILSPADGVVIFSGAKDGFGNFIMIAHGYGIVSRYGHNAQNMVQAGQRVRRGEQIATVGATGRTTGPHLHYEVLVNSKHVDPKKFMLDRF